MTLFIVGAICLVAGFVGGFILQPKTDAKLKAVEQEMKNVEAYASAETRGLIAAIRKHL